MNPPPTPDELDHAHDVVWSRHPDLTGDALARKVRRLIAIRRHAHDGTRWT